MSQPTRNIPENSNSVHDLDLTATQALAIGLSHAFPTIEMADCLYVAKTVEKSMVDIGARVLGPADAACFDTRLDTLLDIHTVLWAFETPEKRTAGSIVERCRYLVGNLYFQARTREVERVERDVARAENAVLRNLLELYLAPAPGMTPAARSVLDMCAKTLLAHPLPGGENQTK
jgi:hypothetical protein